MGKIQHIYKIVNKINQKYYIGRTDNTVERFSTHKRLLKNNKHHSIHFQRAWNKYGEESFEFVIVQEINVGSDEVNLATAKQIEQSFLDQFLVTNVLYNRSQSSVTGVTRGKEHPFFKKHPKEWMGEAWEVTVTRDRTGEKNPFYNKSHTKETIEILKVKCAMYGEDNPFFGRKHTEESKRKMSEANMGKPGYWLGKSLSEVTKAKISETRKLKGYSSHMKGKNHSDETKKKLSEARSKKVEIDGIVYDSLEKAAVVIGVTDVTIGNRCRNSNFPQYKFL